MLLTAARPLACGIQVCDALIPNPTATVPLGDQQTLSSSPWPQPVGVPHHPLHDPILALGADRKEATA